MKSFVTFLCLLTPLAHAASVGDTFDQVLAEKGVPKSKMGAGSNLILNYAAETIQLRDGKVISIKPIQVATPKAPTALVAGTTQGEVIRAERLKAIAKVNLIVNQPVPGIPRVATMRSIGNYPSWFHEGAITPDFNTVDVRATQKLDYQKFEYVYSDLDRGTAFPGREIEFNAMTKFFYQDRTVPKKRLTEQEMIEINRLYRIIGRCDAQLQTLQGR